jgi:hypothetical protein
MSQENTTKPVPACPYKGFEWCPGCYHSSSWTDGTTDDGETCYQCSGNTIIPKK